MAPTRMKHGPEAAAFAVVVRSVANDFIAHAKPPDASVLAALETIERFVAGEPVSYAALDEARQVYDRKEKDQALNWLQGAVGNLAWFCNKERGWQKGEAPIMDAACYALSSLKIDGLRDYDALVAFKAQALTAALAQNKKPIKATGRPAKPVRVKDQLVAFISDKANKRLAKLKAVFNPEQRGNEPSLRALLSKHKLLANDALMQFDERYGGLVFTDDGELDWMIGAHACLASGAHSVDPGERVPVAYSPNDVIFYLDQAGVAWVHDTIEGETERYADNGDAMIEKIILSQ